MKRSGELQLLAEEWRCLPLKLTEQRRFQKPMTHAESRDQAFEFKSPTQLSWPPLGSPHSLETSQSAVSVTRPPFCFQASTPSARPSPKPSDSQICQEMDSAQKKFEAKAAQFREISAKMRRGALVRTEGGCETNPVRRRGPGAGWQNTVHYGPLDPSSLTTLEQVYKDASFFWRLVLSTIRFVGGGR